MSQQANRTPVDLAEIPAFPPIALRVLDLLSRDDVRVPDLTGLISSDPVLAAQVLRLANSAQFGHKSRIDNLNRALTTLGLSRVQSLSITVATCNYARVALKFAELRRCWQHTLACAVLSRELARACGLPEDRAYGVGLLHDIGRLALLVCYPAEYALLLRDADRDIEGLLNLESRRFGMDHCEAGRQLAARWQLPPDFAVAAGRHHDTPSGEAPDLLTVVHVACRLADALSFSVVAPLRPAAFEDVVALLPPAARQRLGADAEVLRAEVQRSIESYDSADPRPAHAASGLSVSEEPEPAPPDPPLPRSLLREAAMAAAIGAVFLAVVLCAYFIWAR